MENRYRYGKRLYRIWTGMRARCRTKTHHAYDRYGGRGITVCPEWEDYETFAQWALANGYAEDLTIERVDVNGNYCPENCTWITREDQARNRRSNINIEVGGVVKTGAEWAKELGMGKQTVLRRLRKGMTPEEAVSLPRMKPIPPLKTVFQYKDSELVGIWACAKEAAEAVGGSPRTIKWACNSGGKNAYGFIWTYEKRKKEEKT